MNAEKSWKGVSYTYNEILIFNKKEKKSNILFRI